MDERAHRPILEWTHFLSTQKRYKHDLGTYEWIIHPYITIWFDKCFKYILYWKYWYFRKLALSIDTEVYLAV